MKTRNITLCLLILVACIAGAPPVVREAIIVYYSPSPSTAPLSAAFVSALSWLLAAIGALLIPWMKRSGVWALALSLIAGELSPATRLCLIPFLGRLTEDTAPVIVTLVNLAVMIGVLWRPTIDKENLAVPIEDLSTTTSASTGTIWLGTNWRILAFLGGFFYIANFVVASPLLIFAGLYALYRARRTMKVSFYRLAIAIIVCCPVAFVLLQAAGYGCRPTYGLMPPACIITVPILLISGSIFLAGLLAVGGLRHLPARRAILPLAPLGSLCALGFIFLSRHLAVYDELFLSSLDAAGNELASHVLRSRFEYPKYSINNSLRTFNSEAVFAGIKDRFWIMEREMRDYKPRYYIKMFALSKLPGPLWTKQLRLSESWGVMSLAPDEDGGIIVIVNNDTGSFRPPLSWWTTKFDSNGLEDVTWKLGEVVRSWSGHILGVVPDLQGAFYLLVRPDGGEESKDSLSIRKFDARGQQIVDGWNELSFQVSSRDSRFVRAIADEARALYLFLPRDGKYFLLKFSPEGNKLWEAELLLEKRSDPPLLVSDKTDGVLVIGSHETVTGARRLWFRRFDTNGREDPKWAKLISLPAKSIELAGTTHTYVDTEKNVYAGGVTKSLRGREDTYDWSWWLNKFARDGNEVPEWRRPLAYDNAQERIIALSADSEGNAFVIGQRRGFGYSSESLFNSVLNWIPYSSRANGVGGMPAVLTKEIAASTGAEVGWFPNPYESGCKTSQALLNKRLEPNHPNGPQNLQYVSNFDGTITFSWTCPDTLKGGALPTPDANGRYAYGSEPWRREYFFNWSCCTCKSLSHNGGGERLKKSAITIEVEPDEDYEWWATCGSDYAGKDSHSNVARLGPPGSRSLYRYYEPPH